ncbi:MAG TPA: DUF2147 domain-containing protein [Xanthobacteraceae bacterium]|nr:DUF2147 domain-containing protein [Xanthobacteraceae bacterium]
MRVYLAALMIVVSSLALQGQSARAAEPSAAGLWQQVDKATGKPDAWFLVTEHDGLYDATLVKLFSKPGGRPNPLCTQCSGDEKNAPWLGLTVVKGMARDGLDYESGTVLDPRDGSQYYGQMQLSPDGQALTVRGDLGIDPLGGNETWRRLPRSALQCA